jgi:hypothetical protein
MGKPQLGSLTNFNGSSNTVTSESFNLDANLYNLGIPLVDIDSGVGSLPGSINISLRAKKRVLVITGLFRGTESTILSFINEIEAEAKSSTQTKKTYTTSVGKTYSVKINNFTYVSAPNTNKIEYTLELFTQTA